VKNLTAFLIITYGVWLAVPAAAHHSMTGFDRNNPVTLTGVVKSFGWQNPHCYIEIEVPDKSGKIVTWNIEMTAPGYLVRSGWKKTDVKAGDRVTIVAAPLRSGEPGALFESITLPGGEKLTQQGRQSAAKAQ
jgi:Family of unknown function (DUF6152)